MILDFGCFVINEASLKKLKREVHGALNMSARKRMRRELRDNIITFKFKKRNGDIRTAHGTLHPDYLPPLKGGGPRPEHQMVYYDLDKEGWRSFRSYTFIKILNIKPVEGKHIGPKVTSKPTPKEEEEIKKTAVEREEEKVKKPILKKKDEDVDEDGEKHAYKSPIYDETKEEKKERLEDDEKIEKLKHKDEDEPKEKDKEEKSEDE